MNPPTLSPIQALDFVIDTFFGGKAVRFAEAIGLSAQMVSFMRKGEREIPADKAPLIEKASGAARTVEELCPNTSWVRIADPEWPHPQGRPLIDPAGDDKALSPPVGEGAAGVVSPTYQGPDRRNHLKAN